jgi:transposase
MKAYSLDLRTRIVHAVDQGMAQTVAARTFGVSPATVKRYLQRQAAGTLAPRHSPGRPRVIAAAAEPALQAQLAATPDATLAEHAAQWATDQGVTVSVTTVHRAIARLAWTRKKRPSTPASKTP